MKRLMKRVILEARQYGFIRVAPAFSDRGAPRILVNSIPKSGTNLLSRVFVVVFGIPRYFSKTITDDDFKRRGEGWLDSKLKSNRFLVSHLPFSEGLANYLENSNVIQVLVVRDPRDIVVSNARYIHKDKTHRLSPYYRKFLHSEEERISASISGVNGVVEGKPVSSLSIDKYINSYSGWLLDRNTVVVSYEDLVGVNGGGDESRQLEAVNRIAEKCFRVKLDSKYHLRLQQIYTSGSRTFHSSKIATWKKAFSKKNESEFNKIAGEVLDKYGYGD